tara:strand:- start:191 stop:958 length:768 start_codon:yes stop_codon:yes gene_type:complete
MKVVILVGGFGTRLGEETELLPKPMIKIGQFPILWHIMKIYSAWGFNDFILALGYKSEIIKNYFLNYASINSDFTINIKSGKIQNTKKKIEDWNVSLVDTGLNTMTGGRLKRLKSIIGNETFMLTYGDGLADIDVSKVLEFHKNHKKMVTVTTVHPGARFGELNINDNIVKAFKEKPQTSQGWINGGFFIIEPEFFEFIEGDETVLEGEPLEKAASMGELMAYRHEGFWHCMDTVRDKKVLEDLFSKEKAPWKIW